MSAPAADLSAGITGHQRFPQDIYRMIAAEVGKTLLLDRVRVGYSALALGADQIFAEQILLAGGSLISIQPCARYADTFESDYDRCKYFDLRNRATKVIELPFIEPSEEAFWAAGQRIVDESDLLIAVWDGQRSAGLGGTADVVEYARHKNRRVVVVWPQGSKRI